MEDQSIMADGRVVALNSIGNGELRFLYLDIKLWIFSTYIILFAVRTLAFRFKFRFRIFHIIEINIATC